MPRPATGKTPVRNLRSADDIWLPALARAEEQGTTITDVINAHLREYGKPAAPGTFDFTSRPDAQEWLESAYPAWRECASALTEAISGFVGEEYIGVALWLGITHHPGDVKQQKRVVAGHLLRAAHKVKRGGWRDRYIDSRALLRAVEAVLDAHLTALRPPGIRHDADGAAEASRRLAADR